MHKLLLASVFILITSLCAVAQDKVYDWTGFYVGANIFASRDDIKGPAAFTSVQQITNIFVAGRGLVVVPGTAVPQTTSGSETKWGGGGHAGYLWQRGHFVFGPEGEFDPIRRTFTFFDSTVMPATILSPPTGVVVTAKQDYRFSQELSVRGRVGYAFSRTLVYGAAGYANTNVRITGVGTFTSAGGLSPGSGPPACNTAPDSPCFNSGPEGPVVTTITGERRKGGWTAGGGFDQAIAKHLSVGAEYRHTDMGNTNNFTFTGSTVNTGPEVHGTNGATGTIGSAHPVVGNSTMHSDSIRFRFNFHF